MTLRKAAGMRRIGIYTGTEVYDIKIKRLVIEFKCGL